MDVSFTAECRVLKRSLSIRRLDDSTWASPGGMPHEIPGAASPCDVTPRPSRALSSRWNGRGQPSSCTRTTRPQRSMALGGTTRWNHPVPGPLSTLGPCASLDHLDRTAAAAPDRRNQTVLEANPRPLAIYLLVRALHYAGGGDAGLMLREQAPAVLEFGDPRHTVRFAAELIAPTRSLEHVSVNGSATWLTTWV